MFVSTGVLGAAWLATAGTALTRRWCRHDGDRRPGRNDQKDLEMAMLGAQTFTIAALLLPAWWLEFLFASD